MKPLIGYIFTLKLGSMIQRPSQILIGAVGMKKMNFSTIQNSLKKRMDVILYIDLL